ncbi:hypothetical protein [Desulfosediminicola flagellatus]|uniref:hypothetical protein n=1 Tax=Desulfosediminicola flagellatus TaxID=2569541 RepID=UPI0010ACE3A1|nr:hypothetical protein [Desulfosediminicola flagellatus]
MNINYIIQWCNHNAGFVSILIFIATLVVGFVVWVIKSTKKKPDFKISVIDGPTLATTFNLGFKFNNHEVQRTAISLYLNVINKGHQPANIEKISVAYHMNHIKYRFFWFWLNDQYITFEPFQYSFSGKVKVYPSLIQGNSITFQTAETYLEVGKSTNGVAYFEQGDSWGSFKPMSSKNRTKVKIKIEDSLGKKHYEVVNIPTVPLSEAKKYNPSFGETISTIQNENKN